MGRPRTPRPRPPRGWMAIGIVGALLGAAFWVAVIVVAAHFIGKYW
jgi:hypothetical protein